MDYIACNYDAIITIPLATLHVKIYTQAYTPTTTAWEYNILIIYSTSQA